MKSLIVASICAIGILVGAGGFVALSPTGDGGRPAAGQPQEKTAASCCASPTAEFAMLGSDPKFVNAHEAPAPYQGDSIQGRWRTFPTPDDSTGRAFEIAASKPTNTYLFVFQEWWGVNDYIKREAARLQRELGPVTVLALDLYDGKVATTAEEAPKIMQNVREERARAIIQGALTMIGPDARLGTLGWCFGGAWSLQAAIMGGKQTAACVMFYGMPEKDVEKLKDLEAPVLGIFGKEDKFINPDVVREFQANMKKAGKTLTVRSYDADHAFANPSNPKFDSKATKDAFKRTNTFLKKNLLGKKS